jgi:hypothetical protein
MAVPDWKFILVESKDLDNAIGELYEARSKNINVGLNKPGSCSFTYPFSGTLAEDIQPISTAVMAYRRGSTGLYKLIWSGYVNEVNSDAVTEEMQISCVGWFERLNKRISKQDVLYSSQYDNDIIFGTGLVTPSTPSASSGATNTASGILRLANLTSSTASGTTTSSGYSIPSSVTIPIVSGSDPNTPTLIQPGIYTSGTTITPSATAVRKNFKIEKDQSFGEAIISLTEQENGPDIDIHPQTRSLNVYRKKGERRTGLYFSYGWGAENIQSFSKLITTDQLANHLIGRANGVSPVLLNNNTTSLNSYGLFESVVNLNMNVPNQDTLNYYTAAEYLFTSTPLVSYSITPFPYTIGSSVPEPFEDYDIGDQLNLRVVAKPIIDIGADSEETFRVFGINVSIEDNGNETIGELQIYYAG